MRAQFSGKKNLAGFATLEILISFTIIILAISAVMLVSFGNEAINIDAQTNLEAVFLSKNILEEAEAISNNSFTSLESYTVNPTLISPYTKTLTVKSLSACTSDVRSITEWVSFERNQKVEIPSIFTNINESIHLGGDCPSDATTRNWEDSEVFASDNGMNGRPFSIDVLNQIVYIGSDQEPYLSIIDSSNVIPDQSENTITQFANNFSTGAPINFIDAVWDYSKDKTYLFTAISSSTEQLRVLDVTNSENPVTIAVRSLSECVSGSSPQAWRLFYYDSVLYLSTRYTAGPELHIFNVEDPANPIEYPIGSDLCKGLDLGDTVNSISATQIKVSDINRTYLFLATSENDRELRVFDVTNPMSPIEIIGAGQDLPGTQNGMDTYIFGNKLFFGRQSTPTGADLYVYDISNPSEGLEILGSKDIGTGVNKIRVVGDFAFLSTPRANQQLQIWNVSDLSNISLVETLNSGSIAEKGMDYDSERIFITGQMSPKFKIIYNQ